MLNLLHRLIDGKTTGCLELDTPQALTLRREPNVERYDGLRAHLAVAMRHDPASGAIVTPEDAWHGTGRHRSHRNGGAGL